MAINMNIQKKTNCSETDNNLHRCIENKSDIPGSVLQILGSTHADVRLSTKQFINAVNQLIKYLRTEADMHSNVNAASNHEKSLLAPLLNAKGHSLQRTVEDMVTFEFVEKVRKSFAEADIDNTGYLDINEFTAFLRRTYPDMTDREAHVVFMKIGMEKCISLVKTCILFCVLLDTNCDGEVDLSEYLTYILFEHQEREIMYEMSKPVPYPNKPTEITSKSFTADTYIGFQFFPGISRSGKILDEIDYTYGRYLSITRYGIVSHWSISLRPIRELKLESIERGKQNAPLWITSICVLPDMNYFAVATTERDLTFYDLNSHVYTGSVMISHFPTTLTAMDYRMNLKHASQCAMFCGDSLGNLFIFRPKDHYRPMFHISDVARSMEAGSTRIFLFPDILNDEYLTVSVTCFRHLHDDWIGQVKWISDLDIFVTCALTTQRSLYIGDLDKKMKKYASIKKGLAAFDYCKAHRSIVTASSDGIIRFWNPFATEQAVTVLRGHNSSVTHLSVDNLENRLISIDKEKNIIIWDVKTLKVVQRISRTLLDLSDQDVTIFYLNPTQQRLIIGNRKLISLSHINESYVHDERTSHLHSITRIIYNPLFDVVISADENSTINIWNIKTGEKVMHILNAHVIQYDGYNERAVEITAICLDEAKRRLITGAHDGSLALWNFNNGHNLYRVHSDDIYAKEITALIHTGERLFVAGWSRRIRVFHLSKSVVMRQVDEFRSLHNDDILSMSMMMNILATASYDGDIILWTIETGMPFMKLNSSQDTSPKLMTFSLLSKPTTKDTKQSVFPKYFSRRGMKKLMKRTMNNHERNRQSSLKVLRINPDTSSENITKPVVEHEPNQSTISSDYHLDQLIFLHTRDVSPHTASLITAGSHGWVWWWSIHVIGSLISVFNGARKPQEHILSMCVDENCNILFTSDTAGYVALWFIGDYANKQSESKERQMKLASEKSRLLKLFSSSLNKTSHELREMKNQLEKNLRDQLGIPPVDANKDRTSFLKNNITYPPLLIAYRAHTRPITSMCYANDREIVITSSFDCTIRLFTLTGRYIGYMGQSVPWESWTSNNIVKNLSKQIPEDIRRIGSATTLELLRGNINKRWKLLKHTIVAWTSLPTFQQLYKAKSSRSQPTSENSQAQVTIYNSPNDSMTNRSQKDHADLISKSKNISVESMLKSQRDNFGITMPVLGRFIRKYTHYRSISNFDPVEIRGGKAIIYSLLPLTEISDEISQLKLNLSGVENDTSAIFGAMKSEEDARKEYVEPVATGLLDSLSKKRSPNEEKLGKVKKNHRMSQCR